MTKISDRIFDRYISAYQDRKGGTRYRVCLPDGIGNQIRKQGFLTSIAAKEFAIITLTKRKPTQVGASFTKQMTFSELASEWLLDRKHNRCEFQTLHRYESEVRLRLQPFFGKIRLADLQKDHLRRYIQQLRKEELSDSSISLSVAQFKQILKYAEVNDYVQVTGIRELPSPAKKQKEAEVWTDSEIEFFLEATKSHKNHLLWKFAIFTGMRSGEISALKWECVDPHRKLGDWTGVIEVRRTWEQKSRSVKETPKNGSSRVIPILPEIHGFLSNRPQGAVFVFGGDKPLESTHFARDLKRELEKYPNLPKITFHGLRHSLCTKLEANGYPRRLVSHVLGHKDLSTTDRYSHVRDEWIGNELSRCFRQKNQQNSNKVQDQI